MLTPRKIAESVAISERVNFFDLICRSGGTSTAQDVVWARRLAIWLSCKLTKATPDDICQVFGLKQRKTIKTSCDFIEGEITYTPREAWRRVRRRAKK